MSEIISLFTEIQGGLDGFWSDYLSIDELMIENKKCPKCRAKLVYKGFSNKTLYKAFGICESASSPNYSGLNRWSLKQAKKDFQKAV